MGAGYGLANAGVFRMPYALQRQMYGGGGGKVDPIAALVGNALGPYQAGREKDIYDALQAKKEQDEADWRQYQVGAQAAEKGLTATAPAGTPVVPNLPTAPYSQSMTPSGTGPGALTLPSGPALQRPDLSAATTMKPPTPVVPGVGKYPALYRDVGQRLREYQPVGEGAGAFDRYSGEVKPTGFTPPAKPGAERNIDPLSPLGIERATERARQESLSRVTPQQMDKAEFGTAALAAWQQVERQRTQHAGVEAEVGKILASPAFVQAVPGIKSSAEMVKLLKTAGASDAAQQYMRAKWSFLDNIIRTRQPGGRMSGAMFAQVQNEFMPSLDSAANAQIHSNELQAILSAQGGAGYDVTPDLWNRAAKRHGVDKIDLQNLLAGGSGYNPKHTDYPPGFVPK